MKGHHFDTHHPITVISFLKTFHQTSNNNVFEEGAAMLILPSYIRKPKGTALAARFRVPEERDASPVGMFASYLAVNNHFLRT